MMIARKQMKLKNRFKMRKLEFSRLNKIINFNCQLLKHVHNNNNNKNNHHHHHSILSKWFFNNNYYYNAKNH